MAPPRAHRCKQTKGHATNNLFFVLASAALELAALLQPRFIGAAYIICRALGKLIGARLGGELARADRNTENWMGLALLRQAGVAIGIALVASNFLPEHRQIMLSIVTGPTVLFENIGPVFTSLVIMHTQSIGSADLPSPGMDIVYCGINGLQFLIVTRPCSRLPREYSLNKQVLVAGS